MNHQSTFPVCKGFILIQVLLCLMVLSWMAMALFEQTAWMVKACDGIARHEQNALQSQDYLVDASNDRKGFPAGIPGTASIKRHVVATNANKASPTLH